MSGEPATYIHGHHESVLRSHRWRSAENSAGYLLPHLAEEAVLLDVGCGPGSITVDLAARVPDGRVVGVDNVAAPLDGARAEAARQGVPNVEFRVGDVYDLPFEDHRFDVVHAHQVLQHLADPVAALTELLRVCRPGGLVAARDADYGAMAWYPVTDGLQRWRTLYRQAAHAGGGEPDAGRRLHAWARRAGATDVTSTVSAWCFATPDERRWWGGTWAQRVVASTFAAQCTSNGFASTADLEELAAAWQEWSDDPDGWFLVPHGEILCRVGAPSLG